MGKMMLLILRVGSVVTIMEDDSREKNRLRRNEIHLGLKTKRLGALCAKSTPNET